MTDADDGAGGPLAGVRVLVPRARAQAGSLSRRILAAGGEPVEAPVLVIGPGDEPALRSAVRELGDGRFAMVCFTSPNGVTAVAAAVSAEGLDAAAVRAAGRLACVGPGTARVLRRELGLVPDLQPSAATTAALGDVVPPGRGRVLLPRADIASPVLPALLENKGYTPVEVVAYRTSSPPALPDVVVDDLQAGRIHVIAVASPSTARNLVSLLGGSAAPLQRSRVVSIGPVTTAACRELGVTVAEEADPHTIDGLVAALIRAGE